MESQNGALLLAHSLQFTHFSHFSVFASLDFSLVCHAKWSHPATLRFSLTKLETQRMYVTLPHLF